MESNQITKQICPICSKLFSTNGNLKNHIMTIHKNIRPYKCSFTGCNKEYSNKSRLEVHIRTHTGARPYVCTICSKSFNEKGNLKTHIGFHTDNRPFKCDQCNKTYKTNGHLKDHIEIQHMKIRRFECQICESKFGRRSTLIAHMRTHTGEKDYKCPIEGCEKRFAEKGNMSMHYKRHMRKLLRKNEVTENISNGKTRPPSDLNINSDKSKEEMLKEENDFWKKNDDLLIFENDSLFNTNFTFDVQMKESNMCYINDNEYFNLSFE